MGNVLNKSLVKHLPDKSPVKHDPITQETKKVNETFLRKTFTNEKDLQNEIDGFNHLIGNCLQDSEGTQVDSHQDLAKYFIFVNPNEKQEKKAEYYNKKNT